MKNKLILQEKGKDPLYKIWHTNHRALLLYVHSGKGSVVTREGNYPIQKNTLFLIPPGTYHYTMPDEPEDYIRSKILLSSAAYKGVEELLRPYGELRELFGRTVVYARIPAGLQAAVEEIFSEPAALKEEKAAPLLLAGALRLLLYLREYAAESQAPAADFMGRAIRYINENIALELDLDSICSAINVSKYYFCRQFKQRMGITVMQYILHTRIMLAREALEKTDQSITRISEECGFSSVSYFCRVFKAETGLSPLQYRKAANR